MKRVILEGPDGAGKTTLAAALSNRFPQLEVIPGFKKQTQEKIYEHWVFQQLLYSPVDKIPLHDRFYYSEIVYGMVMRGSVDIMPHAQRQIEQVLRSEAFLIYCNSDRDTLIRAASLHPQMDGVLQNMDLLSEQYENLMMEEYKYFGAGRFQHYDFQSKSDESVLMYKLEGYLGH